MNEDVSASPAAPAPEPAPHPRRRLGRVLGVIALVLVGLGVLAGLGLWSAWRSESAMHALLQRVPGLQTQGLVGRPSGGPFAADRLVWRGAGLVVTIEGLAWREAQWTWRPHTHAWLGLRLEELRVRRVQVQTTPSEEPSSPREPSAPADLRLPVAVEARDARIDTVQVNALPPATQWVIDLDVGGRGGDQHRVGLQGDWAAHRLSLQAQVGAVGPMPVAATVRVRPVGAQTTAAAEAAPSASPLPEPLRAVQLDLQAEGPLARLPLRASLAAAGGTAELEATATPFAAFPLAALDLRLHALDLARLASAMPTTTLEGHVTLREGASAEALGLDLSLANTRPGPWDEARLPLRRLSATLHAQPGDAAQLRLDALDAELGQHASGGRLHGTAQWVARRLALDLQVDGLDTAQLDRRAPALTVGGPVNATVEGLVAPGATGAAAAPAASGEAWGGTLRTALQGRARDLGRDWQAEAQGRFASRDDGQLDLQLERFSARAGEARAEAQARADRSAEGGWSLVSDGRLTRFDPGVWWPALTGGRATQLNGQWQADLRGLRLPEAETSPATATAASAPAPAASAPMLAALRGQARLQLQDSRYAGVPVSADARLDAREALALVAWFDAAGNRVQLDGEGLSDLPRARWQFALDAPALGRLDPWAALAPGVTDWLPTAGRASAQGQWRGAWPRLQTDGRFDANGLRAPAFALERAEGRWAWAGLAADAPLALQVEASGLAQGERRIDRLHAQVDGSLRRHRFALDADSPLRPPAWTDAMAGAPAGSGSALRLAGQGRWEPQAGSLAGVWQGDIEQLRAAPRTPGAAPWLAAEALQFTLALDAAGTPRVARAAPGRLSAFGAALRWQEAQWQAAPATAAAGTPPRFALDAVLEPMRIAPVLAALQPDLGWHGELTLGARVRARHDGRFSAQAQLERGTGDLALRLGSVERPLGLERLSVALDVDGGRWQARQSIAGTQLGSLSGTQQARADPAALWPGEAAAIDGNVDVRAPDLSVWAPLLPPGWRLGGQLQAQVSLGGRLGEPVLNGQANGEQLLLANLFEGVNLRDGRLRATLAGQDLRLHELRFQGGRSGTLSAEGSVRLGAQPQGQLQVQARNFRALNRFDRRINVSGDATLATRGERVAVQGRFRVDRGRIDVSQSDAPSLDDDVRVVDATEADTLTPPGAGAEEPQAGALAAVDLDLQVDLGDSLRVRGKGLDTRLAGALQLTAPNGDLTVRGSVQTVDGTYTAYGQNLVIDRGVIDFAGEMSNPRLDIVAVRPDVDLVRVGVVVSGPAVDPRVRLYSEPEMAQMDQLTWLLLGRAPEGIGREESALLQRAALALLAGDKGAGEGGFLQSLGIDQLSVRRGATGDAQDTVVGLGKQLSKRLFIGYERALSAAGGSWQLIYRIAGRTTLRAQTGEDSAVDAIWTWRWN